MTDSQMMQTRKRSSDGDIVIARNVVKPGNNTPVFLQKTYDMIESSPDHIACWSDAGTSFIIKAPREFAKDMLPRYFKHNNFSSFVRQLNFYGFRKHKKDEIVITDQDDESKNWWEFYHEKFVRGKKELMAQIRRKTYSESSSPEREEVETLKNSVERLQGQVSELMGQLGDVTMLVKSLLQEKQFGLPPFEEPPAKRVKTNDGNVLEQDLPSMQELSAAPPSMDQPGMLPEMDLKSDKLGMLDWPQGYNDIEYFGGDSRAFFGADDMLHNYE